MTTPDEVPGILIVTGMPAAGKSTVNQLAAEKPARSARMDGDCPVVFVVLAPGTESCKYRNTIRNPEAQFPFDGYEALDASMHRELGDVGWWFDTSGLSPEETTEQLLTQAPQRALVT